MAAHDVFSHTGGDGSQVGLRATSAEFDWSTVGENIAAGQPTGEAAMDGWVGSPGHCRNLTSGRFTSLGLACVPGGDGSCRTYRTQVLGRPC